MSVQHAEHRQKVTLDDLNTLAQALGFGRRAYFTAKSWNELIDFANERSHPDFAPLPRHRSGSILTANAWNALVDRINDLELR